MYVLVTEMEIYMEFGIEVPVGWYLFYLSEHWCFLSSNSSELYHHPT